jgi:hypothetical protein
MAADLQNAGLNLFRGTKIELLGVADFNMELKE